MKLSASAIDQLSTMIDTYTVLADGAVVIHGQDADGYATFTHVPSETVRRIASDSAAKLAPPSRYYYQVSFGSRASDLYTYWSAEKFEAGDIVSVPVRYPNARYDHDTTATVRKTGAGLGMTIPAEDIKEIGALSIPAPSFARP